MSILETPGLWYTDENLKHQGILIQDTNKGEIRLEIYGDKYIDGPDAMSHRSSFIRFHETIICESAHMTLYNCTWSGTTYVGDNLARITYSVEFIIHGKQKSSDIKIKSGTFIINRFSGWYDGYAINDKIKGVGGLYIDGKEVYRKDEREDVIEVNDNLTIYAWDRIEERVIEFSTHYSIQYFKYVTLKYAQDVTFEQLLTDALSLQKLLAVSYSQSDLYRRVLSIVANTDTIIGKYSELDKKPYVKLDISNYTLHKNRKLMHGAEPSYNTLFSNSNSSRDELNHIIVNWFKNQEECRHIYEYYIDSNRWFKEEGALISNVMFNNRFLNMIQALEDYHRNAIAPDAVNDDEVFRENKRQVLTLISDARLKKWVNDNLSNSTKRKYTLHVRLSEIIEHCKSIAGSIFININLDNFPERAKHYRHLLSHGSSRKVSHGRELIVLFHVAQVLLAICILKSLDVNDIDNKISKNTKMRDNIHEFLAYTNAHK